MDGLLQILEEIGLQPVFIFPVCLKRIGEILIVGKGKGIHSVVDKLAHGIVIPKAQFISPLQTAGQPEHKPAGIAVVVSS